MDHGIRCKMKNFNYIFYISTTLIQKRASSEYFYTMWHLRFLEALKAAGISWREWCWMSGDQSNIALMFLENKQPLQVLMIKRIFSKIVLTNKPLVIWKDEEDKKKWVTRIHIKYIFNQFPWTQSWMILEVVFENTSAKTPMMILGF